MRPRRNAPRDLRISPPSRWPAFLKPTEMAVILDQSVRSVQRRMADGDLGHIVMIGGRRYVARDEFLAALRARTRIVKPPRRRHEVRARAKGNAR